MANGSASAAQKSTSNGASGPQGGGTSGQSGSDPLMREFETDVDILEPNDVVLANDGLERQDFTYSNLHQGTISQDLEEGMSEGNGVVSSEALETQGVEKDTEDTLPPASEVSKASDPAPADESNYTPLSPAWTPPSESSTGDDAVEKPQAPVAQEPAEPRASFAANEFDSNSVQEAASPTARPQDTQEEEITPVEVDPFSSVPTDILLDGGVISELAGTGTTVATLSSVDSDSGDSFTYQLVDENGDPVVDSNFEIVDDQIQVKAGSGLDFETSTTHTLNIQTTDQSGNTFVKEVTISLTDADEFDVGAISDTNGEANIVAENVEIGTTVGITASATDADGTASVSYSLSDDAGGLFAIDPVTGVVTVAGAIDRESAASHNIEVTATSTDGSTSTQTYTISVSDIDEFDTGAVTDSNAEANTASEWASPGTVVGVTASAADADATDGVSYSIVDINGDPVEGGPFAVDANTGVVTVADGDQLNYEASSSETIYIKATSDDGSSSQESFVIAITDEDEMDVGVISDTDGGANTVAENVEVGTTVGITASASDGDGTDTVTYSLSDDAGGLFAIDANTGVVTVAGAIDRETAASYDIEVTATSSDTSTSTQSYTINVSDIDEFDVTTPTDGDGGANSVSESAENGTSVGVTASASDADATTNGITYSVVDNEGTPVAGGPFAVDANTGVVTVADNTQLDYEGDSTPTVYIMATSADGSTSQEAFTINLTNAMDETPTDITFTGGTVNETVADGGTIGSAYDPSGDTVATLATTDADSGDTFTYTITNDPSGHYEIVGNEVRVKSGQTIDYETETSHDITIQVTDSGGATYSETITINVQDYEGSYTGTGGDDTQTGTSEEDTISAGAGDDTIVGSAGADDIDGGTGNDTVDYSDSSERVNVNLASGQGNDGDADGDTYTSIESVVGSDFNDYVYGNTSEGTTANLGAGNDVFDNTHGDPNQHDTIYAEDGNDNVWTGSGNDFIDGGAGNDSLRGEDGDDTILGGEGNDIIIGGSGDDRMTGGAGDDNIDGSSGTDTAVYSGNWSDYTVTVSGSNYIIVDNRDGSPDGTDTVNKSNVEFFEFADGTVANADLLNDTSTDISMTGGSVAENSAGGTVVATLSNTDADSSIASETATYSITNDPSGHFEIVGNEVRVKAGVDIDYETATSHDITVEVTDVHGATYSETLTVNVTDIDEADIGAISDTDGGANTVAENVAVGTTVGITASATDADGSATITYSLSDDAGGLFTIDANTGVVTVAGAIDRETAASYDIEVTATSSDLSTSTQSYTINVSDIDEFDVTTPTDVDGGANSVAENAANGTAVGVTASASDADATTNGITYSVVDNEGTPVAGGPFAVDANTGVVTVVDNTQLDYEGDPTPTVYIMATSTDGSTSQEAFTINLTDVIDETPTDITFTGGTVNETVADGGTIGSAYDPSGDVVATLATTDADSGDTFTYTITNDPSGHYEIVGNEVRVAAGQTIDYETDTSHDITIQVTDSGGATYSETITINVQDYEGSYTGTGGDDTQTGTSEEDTISAGAGDDTIVGSAGADDIDGGTGNDTVDYSDSSEGVLVNLEHSRGTGGDAEGDTYTSIETVVASDFVDHVQGSREEGVTAYMGDGDDKFDNTQGYVNQHDTVYAEGGDDLVYTGDGNDFMDGGTGDDILNGEGGNDTMIGGEGNDTFYGGYGDDRMTGGAGDDIIIGNDGDDTAVYSGNWSDYTITQSGSSYIIVDNREGSPDGTDSVNRFSVENFEFADGTVLAADLLNDTSTDISMTGGSIAENSAGGTVVATLSNTDADSSIASETATYSITNDPSGHFEIVGNEVRVVEGADIDMETATSHDITVQVTDVHGASYSETLTINITDVDEFDVSSPTDGDGTANSVAENAANGTAVGVTASASDADATTNGITYSVVDINGDPVADGPFAVDANTGVVTVADNTQLDYETATSQTVYIQATSEDGSTSQESFVVNLTDEFDEAATDVNYTMEDGNLLTNGSFESGTTGWTNDNGTVEAAGDHNYAITGTDGSNVAELDSANNVDNLYQDVQTVSGQTYELNLDVAQRGNNDTATDSNTVEVYWNGALVDTIDPETTNLETYTFNVVGTGGSDRLEFREPSGDNDGSGGIIDNVSLVTTVPEGAANGTIATTVTAVTDADAGDTHTFTLLDDAGGAFAIDLNSGQVTVADGSLIDYETAQSMNVTVRVTDAGGNSYDEVVAIKISDVDEFDVGAISDTDGGGNTVAENVVVGTTVGITASATDADGTDSVTYSLSDDAGGLFTIDADTGVVTVAGAIDRESAASYDIEVTATSSDASTSTQSYTINVSDIDEFDTGAVTDVAAVANEMDEGAASANQFTGVQASATDADATDTISYSVDDSRFVVTSNGAVYAVEGTVFDTETEASIDIVVTATSSDGSTSNETFTIDVNDIDEFDVGAVTDGDGTANSVSETAANGTTVGVTASATDADATTNGITYSVVDINGDPVAGGPFAVDANTGVVTVADNTQLDYETATSQTVYIKATSEDGSSSQESFVVNLTNEFDEAATDMTFVGNANLDNPGGVIAAGSVIASVDTVVDVEAGDTHTFSLTDTAGGKFAIDANTGEITLNADHSTAGGYYDTVTVRVTDAGGNSYNEVVKINLGTDATQSLGMTNSGSDIWYGFDGDDTLYGSAGDDALYGGEGDNTFYLNNGDDHVDGGAGSDTLMVINGTDNTVDFSAGTYTKDGDFKTITNVENVDMSASTGTNVVTGDDMMNVISTGSGDDTISGGGGADTLSGGAGNDTITGDDGSASANLLVNGGFESDDVADKSSTTSITGWTASSGNIEVYDESTGDMSNNASEGEQFVELDAQGSVDSFYQDVTTVSGQDYTLSLDVANRDGVSTSTNTVEVYWNGALVDSIDPATTDWETHSFTVVGTGGSDRLEFREPSGDNDNQGGLIDNVSLVLSSDDTIDGGEGNDTLIGGAGADAMDGGAGTDTVDYSGATEGVAVAFQNVDNTDGLGGNYQGENAGGLAGEADGDTFTSIEAFTGSAFDDEVYGGDTDMSYSLGDGDDVFDTEDTAVVVDTIDGGAGNDSIWSGAGNDVITGGAGNDVIAGEAGSDLFIFAEGDGTDTIDGGAAGGWTDTIQLEDASGGNNLGTLGTDWTITINSGSISSQDADSMTLSEDADGVIVLQDGSQINFTDIEEIQW